MTVCKKIISTICILMIVLTFVQPISGNEKGKLPITSNKNYTLDSKTYKLDFNKATLGDYKNAEGWNFSNEGNSEIKDSKLYCKSGKAFDIRSSELLGDVYGLLDSEIKFNSMISGGTVSIIVRLKSSVSVVDTGIWFNISKDKVNITVSGTDYNSDIKHNIDLSNEQEIKLVNSLYKIKLYVGGNLIVDVDYDYLGYITVKDGNNQVVGDSVKNVRTQQSGLWKLRINNLKGYIDNLEYTSHTVEQKPFPDREQYTVDYSSWVATDDLNRSTPLYGETPLTRNKYVGVFYFIGHNDNREGQINDVTKIYMEEGLDTLKQKLPKVLGIYWSEPYFGYYLNNDEWVARKHAFMLSQAGVDFIFIDFSNNIVYEPELKVILDTWLKIRKEGGQTPQIVPMCGDMPHVLIHDLYILNNIMYSKPEYEDLFFKWDGKPLILGNDDDPNGGRWTVSEDTVGDYSKETMFTYLTAEEKEFYESGKFREVLNTLTIRKSWAWQAKKYSNNKMFSGYWDWLDDTPQSYGRNFKGVIEQMPVTMGVLAHINRGRSYVNNNSDYGTGLEDFDFTYEKTKYGLLFAEQFEHALKKDPTVIMITGWNEWTAGKQTNSYPNMVTGHTSTPYYHFVDQFNPEFSRDGEPMRVRDGVGFGDNYYYQMVSYIRKFKGMNPVPATSNIDGIDFNIGLTDSSDSSNIVDKKILSQWEKVSTKYTDTLGDTMFRNHPSSGLVYQYLNASGRNDLEYAKVTQDNDYVYFLIKTSDGIITEDTENWMNLYIDIDSNHKTGWEGYDFFINRTRDDKTVSVEKFIDNEWKFESIGSADYLMGTNSLTVKIKKNLLNVSGSKIQFDFKWADNSTVTGNIMQFMDLGDTAPNDRFNFRFTTEVTKITKPFNYLWIIITISFIILAAIVTLFIIKKRRSAK